MATWLERRLGHHDVVRRIIAQRRMSAVLLPCRNITSKNRLLVFPVNSYNQEVGACPGTQLTQPNQRLRGWILGQTTSAKVHT